MRFTSLLLSLSSVATSVVAQLQVSTQQGPVSGTYTSSGVRQWLGVPYASANRWEAPQTPPKRKTVLRADRFGDVCPQAMNVATMTWRKLFGEDGRNLTESEDCLSLNIWAPRTKRGSGSAVVIWIHGGSFAWGSSNSDTWYGESLVKNNDDITFISVNYRMNIFGQPSAPQLLNNGRSQNFGILDFAAAIEWVYANIANFGGDPNRITIMGESAGSAAVDAYTFAYPDSKIVKGVIQMSGSITGRTSGTPGVAANSTSSWNTVARTVGCGAETSDAQFACMKALSSKVIEDAVISTNVNFGLVTDGSTVFADMKDKADSGRFLKVPLLAGTTADEMDIFTLIDQIIAKGQAIPGAFQLKADASTITRYLCPTSTTVQNRVKHGVPTWRYHYKAIFPNLSIHPSLRSYHSSELPLVFSTYKNTRQSPATPEQIALSRYMQTAWVAFARDPVKGLKSKPYSWPTYEHGKDTLVELGGHANMAGAAFARGEVLDRVCAKTDVLQQIQNLANDLIL